MFYRIEIAGRPSKIIPSRSTLLKELKEAAPDTITDIRKLYKSGVSDSVMEAYAGYIGKGGSK